MNARIILAFITIFITTFITTFMAFTVFAAGEPEQPEEQKGPHGGKLLQEGGFSIEVTIFETGIPPEMRLYAYRDAGPLAPGEVTVNATLIRLGGDQDIISFQPEQDYLVGDSEIVEPHSFDVELNATHGSDNYRFQYESHEGRTVISDRLLNLSGVQTELADSRTLETTVQLFGVISIPGNQVYRLSAPYNGLIKGIAVKQGDQVKRGDPVITVQNAATLKTYTITSPITGEVTAQFRSSGDRAENGPIIEIANLDKVWVELSAFPADIEQLKPGQPVTVYDLHEHEIASSQIDFISRQMTGGHIARARAVIDNSNSHWRPGMHVKAQIVTGKITVPLAVRKIAVQSFRDMPVVFARFGNTFEVRMLETGLSDADYLEVTGGLKPGTEYVTENSFLIKADVLKDGASHDH